MRKFSFIIPVYNAEKSIVKCIKSIQNQTYKNIEIVCVNDGSRDNSLKLLTDLQKQDNRIKIINQENSGAFQARKTGILASTGDYVMFADADDVYCNNNCCNVILDVFLNNDIQFVQFVANKKNRLFTKKQSLNVFGLVTLKEIKEVYFKDYLSSESDGIITPVLWNKSFNGDILRQVVDSFDTQLILGEDLLLLLHFLKDEKFKNLYNIDVVMYQYNASIGYSSKLDGTVLELYDELKEYQMLLCNQWQLGDDAVYYCNLESVYFLKCTINDMIVNKNDKNSILCFIEKSSKYKCILLAKDNLKKLPKKYMFDELSFLISDYTPMEYYDYCLNHKQQESLLKRIVKAVLNKI